MIRINLLPHRESRREQRKREFVGNLLATAILGGVLLFAGGLVIDRQITAQAARNAFIGSAIKKLDVEIGEIKNLEGAIASLRARQQAVEDLQSDRTIPVHLFDELFSLMPAGVFLEKFQQTDLNVTLSGFAQSNERVAELLRNLSERSQWLGKPQLEEIKEVLTKDQGSALKPGQPEARRAYEFKLNLLIKRRGPAEGGGKPGTVPAASAAAETPPLVASTRSGATPGTGEASRSGSAP